MMPCGRGGTTPSKTAPFGTSEDQRATLKEQQIPASALWASRTSLLEEDYRRDETQVNHTRPRRARARAWQRQAPQDRAASGSAGKRRTPVSWIKLPSSSEETKRKGARARSGVTCPPRLSSPPPAAGPMKTPWCTSSGALCPLLVLNPGGETPWAWPRRRAPRAQSRRSGDAETKAHCPGSSTCDALTGDQVTPSPVRPQNAGAPSSKRSDRRADADGTRWRRGSSGRRTTSRNANPLTRALPRVQTATAKPNPLSGVACGRWASLF